jgi:hypothetical protein
MLTVVVVVDAMEELRSWRENVAWTGEASVATVAPRTKKR